jgi:hypothetical protein
MTRFRFLPAFVAFAFVFVFATDCFAQSGERTKLEQQIASLAREIREKEKEYLLPSAEDQAAFAEFLSQADTGLIRLMPREKYESKFLTRGGGAYYSFAQSAHEYGYGSDISLEQNHFSVGFAGADFGFLVKLGDVPLEGVSLAHPGVQFLATFAAPLNEPEARRRAQPRIESGGFIYTNRVNASHNTSYALRSIDYDKSDILVAFRVIRQDTDGSMIVLWKLLNKFPTPYLARE